MSTIDLSKVTLEKGSHATRDEGMCAMEAVAWLAGEPHSFQPVCACPVIGAFVVCLNDRMSEEDRNSFLKPLLGRLVGSKASPVVEIRRAFVAADYAVRVFAPQALRAAGKDEIADKLQGLPKIVDRASASVGGDAASDASVAAASAASAAYAAAYAAASADADASAAYAVAASAYAAYASWGNALACIEDMLATTDDV